jgi:hypothetical protein
MAPPNDAFIGGPRPVSYIENGTQWFISLGFITLVNGKATVDTAALDSADIKISDKTALESLIDTLLALGGLPKQFDHFLT